MTSTSIDLGREHIEHYGVLGMKWGVRQKDPNLSRPRAALIERNENFKTNVNAARDGVAFKWSTKLTAAVIGEDRQARNWQMTINNLNDQNDRLRSGRLHVTDRLDLLGNTNLVNMYQSQQVYRRDQE